MNMRVNSISLESSRMEAWVNMELHTLTLQLVAPIGNGSKTTSAQAQELQLTVAVQAAAVEATSTKDASIQMFALMEALSLMVLMAALSMQERLPGVETTTLQSLILEKCAALVVVVIALADKMRKIKVKVMEIKVKVMEIKVMEIKVMESKKKRNKMTLLNALIQMFAPTEALSLMVLMVALSIMMYHLGVEATTMESSNLWICAASAVVAIALADKTREIKVKVMEIKVMENKKKRNKKKRNKMTLLNALIQMFAPTEALSLMVLMVALSIMIIHNGVEVSTMEISILWKCAASVMVVIALVDKMKKTMENKRVMTKKRRMMAKKKRMMAKKKRKMMKMKRMMAKKKRKMTKMKRMMAKKKRKMTKKKRKMTKKKKMMVKKKRMMAKKAKVMAQSPLSVLAHAKAKTSNAGWTASSA